MVILPFSSNHAFYIDLSENEKDQVSLSEKYKLILYLFNSDIPKLSFNTKEVLKVIYNYKEFQPNLRNNNYLIIYFFIFIFIFIFLFIFYVLFIFILNFFLFFF